MADENQQQSTGDDRFLKLAQAAYSESTTYFDAGIRKDIERDLRQFNSQHPADSKYNHESYRTRSRYFRPKTRAAIRKNEAISAAAFFSNEDVVVMEPENSDDKDNVAGALFFQELVNVRLKRSIQWFLTLQGAYQDTQTVGICISYQHWDVNAKRGIDKPCINLRPIENIRFSPGADWRNVVETSPYLIDMMAMYVKDVKARQKSSDPAIAPKWKTVPDEDLLKAQKGYSDSIRLVRESGRQDSTAQPSTINDFSLVWVHRNIISIDDEDWVYYTLGDISLLSEPKKLKDVYHHGMRPYVIGQCILETHKVYPSGVSRLGRATQEEINDNANLRGDNVRFVLNKRYWVRRGAQVDTRSMTRNVPGSVTLMNDVEKDAKVVDTQDVTASAFQEQDRLNNDFDEIAGTFSNSSVQGNRALSDKVGGMELLSSDSNQLSNYQLKVFAETWVKPVIYQLVQLERQYETDEQILALAAKKAKITNVDMVLMSSPLSVSVNVGIGATTPQTRLNTFLVALRSLKEILQDNVLQGAGLDVEQVATEIFGKLGYDSGARFFNWDDAEDPQVTQLKQQIAELEGKLAKKEAPELTAAKVQLITEQVKKTAAEKVKINVEGMFGAMQAAEVIAAVPAVAPIADQIIRAGGYVDPNPQGIDPGFAPGDQGPGSPAAPMAPAPGLAVQDVTNKRTGVGFTPGGAGNPAAAGQALPGGMPVNTNPLTPKPPAPAATGMQGFNGGIETVRNDSGPRK
jgi:hypothetical protein